MSRICVDCKSERDGKRNICIFANTALLFLSVRVLWREMHLNEFTKFFVNVWCTQRRMLGENAIGHSFCLPSNICHICAVFLSLHIKALTPVWEKIPQITELKCRSKNFYECGQSRCNWQLTGSKVKRVLCLCLQCGKWVSLISGIKYIQVINHSKINQSLIVLWTAFFLTHSSLTWSLCSHDDTSYFSMTCFINLPIKFHSNTKASEL